MKRAIRDVPDFPRAGIQFKDITPVLADPTLFARVTAAMAEPFATNGVTHVVAVESRGFVLGAPVAQRLGAGFVPIRKRGKLPGPCASRTYALEYGTDTLEIQSGVLGADARVLIVDDVLATGGTAGAACALVQGEGAAVKGCSFLVVLSFLGGLAALTPHRCTSVVHY
ncbi:MAG: adenine phosphoribosyltransferase [Gemmatimonadaceae bacterium]